MPGFKEDIEGLFGSTLSFVAKQIIKETADTLPSMLDTTNKFLSEHMLKEDKTVWHRYCDSLVEKGFVDRGTADMLYQAGEEMPGKGFILMVIIRLLVYIRIIQSPLQVFDLSRQYTLMAQAAPNPAPVEALVASMMIDPGRASENRTEMKKYGYSDTQIDNIILSQYRKIEENTIRTLYLRGHYDTEKLYERMRELGYTDTRIAEIVKTWQLYPSPQDLFTMVAHEAFEPDIYKVIGLDEEFPSEQIPWLEAQGISKEWAMKYWISHWNQPSLEMGFEMLHRGVINREELDMLFRIVEIPRFWRDKLMAITYNPYTRVDVRRMHELGVISDQELVQAYQDIGYDQEKALKMAEFTIRYNAEGNSEITRSAILTSYHDDLISRQEAKELLTSQDLSEDAAEYYLILEDYKITQENIKLYIDIYKDRFLSGIDSEQEVRSALGKMNLRGSKIDALIENWKTDLYTHQRLPTKSEIDAMLVQGVITQGQWHQIMTRFGYTYEHQQWYLKLLERQLTVSRSLPTKADLQTWYKKKLITADEFRREMRQLGYSDFYIDKYLKSM